MCILTIVTINFNSGEGLGLTYNSVIQQIAHNRETYQWILIDGLSHDKSSDFCRSPYDVNYDVVVSEPDSGIYNAMNKGLDLATGDYILFMNSGDEFFSGFSSKSWTNFLNLNDKCVYYTNVFVKYKYRNNVLVDYSRKSLSFNLGLPFCHQAVYVPKSIYKYNRFDESYRIYATLPYFYQVTKNNRIKHINITSCVYDMSGVSSTISLDNLRELIRFNKNIGEYNIKIFFRIVMLAVKSKIKKLIKFD